MKLAVLGIDLGKNSCSLVGLDQTGAVVLRRRLRRDKVETVVGGFAPCVVAMEACCGAHHIGRALAAIGHEVRLMSPEYVRPYVKAQKNDDRDAEAIAEAATRPTMRFVTLKSEEQLDAQMLHRVRDRLVAERTALTNQIRSILLERGFIIAQGFGPLRTRLNELLADADGLNARLRALLAELREEWQSLDTRIAAFDREFLLQARSTEACQRLTTIPGIGPLNATALVAAVGNAATFKRGRDLAAWLGLVPRQVTTGGVPRLVGITKRGSKYLRKMLIQGARAALRTVVKQETPLSILARLSPATGYVYADCSTPTKNHLADGAGHTFSGEDQAFCKILKSVAGSTALNQPGRCSITAASLYCTRNPRPTIRRSGYKPI